MPRTYTHTCLTHTHVHACSHIICPSSLLWILSAFSLARIYMPHTCTALHANVPRTYSHIHASQIHTYMPHKYTHTCLTNTHIHASQIHTYMPHKYTHRCLTHTHIHACSQAETINYDLLKSRAQSCALQQARYHATTRCNIMQHTATQSIATYSNPELMCLAASPVTRCSTLQYAATRCNTLQYTAMYCNRLQYNQI